MDITFFEIHLDGAQFGPKTIGDATWGGETEEDATEGERMDEETTVVTGEEPSGGRSPPRFAPLFVLFVVGAGYVAYRRFRRGDDGDAVETFDADPDAEAVEIEA